ncbi:hypothetical protein K491DRAFT_716493 [Lophiostoma macrostomum CBS 122681]|uniref:Uncharacterized protein n=1 Tax=Lophiostoma macrostomum CBS 122681 TaxID=1314788 RepID=A0A6A6T749_9PLEO|nr:hypothetical protein K491DRAFT_716493 [Lophiostoma macrostomum CBS 122681]
MKLSAILLALPLAAGLTSATAINRTRLTERKYHTLPNCLAPGQWECMRECIGDFMLWAYADGAQLKDITPKRARHHQCRKNCKDRHRNKPSTCDDWGEDQFGGEAPKLWELVVEHFPLQYNEFEE